jgi:hypothetical protein
MSFLHTSAQSPVGRNLLVTVIRSSIFVINHHDISAGISASHKTHIKEVRISNPKKKAPLRVRECSHLTRDGQAIIFLARETPVFSEKARGMPEKCSERPKSAGNSLWQPLEHPLSQNFCNHPIGISPGTCIAGVRSCPSHQITTCCL